MKIAVYAAASAAVLTAVLAAEPAAAQSAEIRNAVARVIVIPEDRSDVGVEITPGSSGLPRLTLERNGSKVLIDGGLGRRQRLLQTNSISIRECNAGRADARQPGEGASVNVSGLGRIALENAPLIVLRTPRNVDVNADGGVFGSIGRGASTVELGTGGCGTWTVANVPGKLDIAVAGSGTVRAGTSQSLDVAVGGSGSVITGATRDLDVSIGGSGDVVVTRLDGPGEIAIGGSGDVTIRGGRASSLEVSIAGSGDVRFAGTASTLEASIVGSGDVQVDEVTGNVSRSIMGSGGVHIGR